MFPLVVRLKTLVVLTTAAAEHTAQRAGVVQATVPGQRRVETDQNGT